MTANEKFDIFIAYYGNENTGSERYAHDLYEYIKRCDLYPGRKIKAYFHPQTHPYGKFEETPTIVATTPMFILVVDKNIQNAFDGQISRYRKDGSFSYLYDEVSAFHSSIMYKLHGGEQASRLLVLDDFDFIKAASLHPIFGGKTALTSNEAVVDWIKHFYNNAYIERLYIQSKKMAAENKNEFIKGNWVLAAEEILGYTGDENIARSLIIYYVMRANTGNENALVHLRRLVDVMHRRCYNGDSISVNTRELIDKVVTKYL